MAFFRRFWRRQDPEQQPERQPEKPPEDVLRVIELSEDDVRHSRAQWTGWPAGNLPSPRQTQMKPTVLGYDQAVMRAMGVTCVDGEDPYATYPIRDIHDPESARIAPVGKVDGRQGIFYVPVVRGELSRVSLESKVGHPADVQYIPQQEEMIVKRGGMAGRFSEDGVDQMTCIVDRQPRIGETGPYKIPGDAMEIPVTADMIRVDSRRPSFEDSSMPAAAASVMAPDDGQDAEFSARVKGLVEKGGVRITVHGKTAEDAEKPTFTARFVKRNMGSGVYTDVLTLTPFDADDADAVLSVGCESNGPNESMRAEMTERGFSFTRYERHGTSKDDTYFTGVRIVMPFSSRKVGEFTVPVGDEMEESRIRYCITGKDTGQVVITQPDGTWYKVDIASARDELVQVTRNEPGGAYLELSGDSELGGFLRDTAQARAGMYREMQETEGVSRIFAPLFRDIGPVPEAQRPDVVKEGIVGEPLNPALHWNENEYGQHPDAAVNRLLPENLRLPAAYPPDLAVDNQPLGYRAPYPPDQWYEKSHADRTRGRLNRPYTMGFELYQRMGVLAASREYAEEVLSGRRRGIILRPLSPESYGLGLQVDAQQDGNIRFSGMGVGPDPTHYVRTNLMRGGCTCYVSDGKGKVTDFQFYAASTPMDDLGIEQVSVHPRGRERFPVKFVTDGGHYHADPTYKVADGTEGPDAKPPGDDETITVNTDTIPGLTQQQSVTGIREVIGRFYRPFGPGNVLVGRGGGFGLGMSTFSLDRDWIVASADDKLLYTPGPEQEEAFRRALDIGFLDRD
ncbi:MAG: hypothetical protein ABIH11_07710 [Candidatus Altiarchaeota archaeon]